MHRLLLKQTKCLIKIIKKNIRINKKRAEHIDWAITPPYENCLTNNQGEYCIIKETSALINYWWDVSDKHSRCNFIQDYYEEKTNSIEAFLVLLMQLKVYFILPKNRYDLINYYILLELINEVYNQTLILYRTKLLELQEAFQNNKDLKRIQDKKINIIEGLQNLIYSKFDIIESNLLKKII